MKFNPEDGQLTGPRCRNCHRGSSGCGGCHNTDHAFPVLGGNVEPLNAKPGDAGYDDKKALVSNNNRSAITFLFAAMFNYVDSAGTTYGFPDSPSGVAKYGSDEPESIMDYAPLTAYEMTHTTNGLLNEIQAGHTTLAAPTINGQATITDQIRKSRTVQWSDWRQNAGTVGSGIDQNCNDDGISFPHRTLGWKMLKDDLFGIDPGVTQVDPITGLTVTKFVKAGESRTGSYAAGITNKAHDIDSVCLDCHNPTVFNATSTSTHTDTAGVTTDDANDDLLMRGLP